MGTFPGVIHDLSEGGLGLVSGRIPEVGDEIEIVCRLEPGREPLEMRGVVRNADQNRMGVEFLDLTTPNRARLVQFVTAPGPRPRK